MKLKSTIKKRMTEQALRKMIAAGESTRQEFKSWVKCKDYRQRKELAVKSAVALANTKGGVLLFGVEDDGTITGCPKSDPQALMEAIYGYDPAQPVYRN